MIHPTSVLNYNRIGPFGVRKLKNATFIWLFWGTLEGCPRVITVVVVCIHIIIGLLPLRSLSSMAIQIMYFPLYQNEIGNGFSVCLAFFCHFILKLPGRKPGSAKASYNLWRPKAGANWNISFNYRRSVFLWFFTSYFHSIQFNRIHRQREGKIRTKVIWKWGIKIVSSGKVREEVSALWEHCSLLSFSKETFNESPQNIPSSMNQQAISNQST